MVPSLAVAILALLAFGLAFALTGSYASSALATAILVVLVASTVAWSRTRMAHWLPRTRVRIALTVAVVCAAFGVFELFAMRHDTRGIVGLTSAAFLVLSALVMRGGRKQESDE